MTICCGSRAWVISQVELLGKLAVGLPRVDVSMVCALPKPFGTAEREKNQMDTPVLAYSAIQTPPFEEAKLE